MLGVGLGASVGLALAVVFARSRAVRLVCAFLRSIHELFWALLLLQVTGLSPTTGILAIALPYAGVFAKVFSEMIEEADLAAVRVLPSGTGALSAFVYARLPELAVPFKTYTLYRLECGLRSTLVLGFIGLPTMGFHLESAFRQGHYAEAAGLLAVFYALIGTRRLWARPRLPDPARRQRAGSARDGRGRLDRRESRPVSRQTSCLPRCAGPISGPRRRG